VTHRQHQIDLPSAGEVDAGLEVGLAHIAEQVGPISQAGAVIKGERNHLFDCRKQGPGGRCSRGTSDLHLGLEVLCDLGCRWNGLQLCTDTTRHQKEDSHGRAGVKRIAG